MIGHQLEAQVRHGRAKAHAVLVDARAQLSAFRAVEQFEHSQRGPGDGGREGIGEKVRSRALAQQIDDLASSRNVAARGTSEGLAESPGVNVNALFDAA
jgi:hypothetical protein